MMAPPLPPHTPAQPADTDLAVWVGGGHGLEVAAPDLGMQARMPSMHTCMVQAMAYSITDNVRGHLPAGSHVLMVAADAFYNDWMTATWARTVGMKSKMSRDTPLKQAQTSSPAPSRIAALQHNIHVGSGNPLKARAEAGSYARGSWHHAALHGPQSIVA